MDGCGVVLTLGAALLHLPAGAWGRWAADRSRRAARWQAACRSQLASSTFPHGPVATVPGAAAAALFLPPCSDCVAYCDAFASAPLSSWQRTTVTAAPSGGLLPAAPRCASSPHKRSGPDGAAVIYFQSQALST